MINTSERAYGDLSWLIIINTNNYSYNIGMKFAIETCAMLIMKSGKLHRMEGIKLPNQDKIRTLGEKETSKYLAILEADTIKQMEIK